MRRISYIIECAFLATAGMFLSYVVADDYKLLDTVTIPSEIELIDGPDSFAAIDFKENPLTVPTNILTIRDQIVSPPYIVNAVFNMSILASTCIFSLMDDENNFLFNLCIIPIGPSDFTISMHGLESNTFEKIKFSYDILNKWTKMMLYIDTNAVTLRLNCNIIATQDTDELIEDIYFSNDTKLIFGNTIGGGTNFVGAIQEVNIYTNVDESKVKILCDDFSIFDILKDYDTLESDDYLDKGLSESDNDTILLQEERGEPGERGEKGERGDAGLQGIPGDKGLKGEKGEKGETGHKGEPGNSITGPQGPPGLEGREGDKGLRGLKGDMGECECSETVVSSLLRIMPEMRGPPGEPGYPGDPGPMGLTGQTGVRGEQGLPGINGSKGNKGDMGIQGLNGEAGPKGDAGMIGAPGPQGLKGEQGQQGPPGPVYVGTDEKGKTGEKGDRGPEGPKGLPGLKGDMGPIGPVGKDGAKGEKGNEGPMGVEGPIGEKGATGDPGNNGLPGIPGRHGNHGEKGEKGDRGDKGAPGLAGLPASLSSILDTEINPEENAAIVKKLRGYKGDIGDKGDKGDKGDQGLTGIIGPPGEDGKDGIDGKQGIQGLKGEVGPIGLRGFKGDQGEPGPPGQVPASHIALMKGPKGNQGPQGRTGLQGRPGYVGSRGATGPRGLKGSKGDKGYIGVEGKMGRSGINGTIGEKGQKGDSAPPIDLKKLKGEKGEKGDDGISGKPGKEGPQGPPGSPCKETSTSAPIAGPPGSPGLTGPPGPPGLSIIGPKGEPGSIIAHRTDCTFASDYYSGDPDNEDEVCTSSTVIYKTSRALVKRTATTPLGTLAYVLQEKMLLLRVDHGWQYIVMGSLFQHRQPIEKEYKPIEYVSTARPGTGKRRQIRLAALNEPYSGRVYSETDSRRSGHNVANTKCHRESMRWRRGLKSTFVAFLANRVGDLVSLVKPSDRSLPVVNLDGKILFKSWKEMFNGSGAVFARTEPDIYSFSGKNVLIDSYWPQKKIWHGADLFGKRSKEAMCAEWQSDRPDVYGVASSLRNNRLLDHNLYSCNNKLIVLCIEISST